MSAEASFPRNAPFKSHILFEPERERESSNKLGDIPVGMVIYETLTESKSGSDSNSKRKNRYRYYSI